MDVSPCRLMFTNLTDIVRTDLSAVRQVGSHLWLGSDETAGLERLTFSGEVAETHQHFSVADFLDLPGGATEEVDIEGIAYHDGYLWIVGSHSLKRKRVKSEQSPDKSLKRLQKVKREDNRYTLGRIPLVDGQLYQERPHPERPKEILRAAQLKRKKKGNELTHRLKHDPHLGDFLRAQIPGKDNGFDIEGIAAIGDRLWLGLRGPVLRGWAILLELKLAETDPGVLRLQAITDDGARYRKHFLDLDGLGIRDLCPYGESLLILAGPTMTLPGAVRLYRVPLDALQAGSQLLSPTRLHDLPHGEGCDRPEGITLLGPEAKELLVVYDAPCPQRLPNPHTVLADRLRLS